MLLHVSSGLFIGLTPEIAAFKEVVADALGSAVLLGLDAAILGEAIAETDPALGAQYQKTFSQMQDAFSRNEDVLGRQTQFRLAGILRGLSNNQWQMALDNSVRRGAANGGVLSTFDDSLLSARKEIGGKATSLHIAQSQDRKNEKALGELGAQAAYGDIWSREALLEISGGSSPMAEAAAIILDLLPALEELANAKNRMAFAKTAEKILEAEDKKTKHSLQDTRNWDKTGLRMLAFETAFGRVLRALDRKKEEAVSEWKNCEEAHWIIHDEIHTLLQHLHKMGEAIVCGKLKPDSPMPEWFFGPADETTLNGVVKLAARENIRSIISSVVDVYIDVDETLLLHMDKKELKELKKALFELINNGLKYYDPKKEKHWIRITWNPSSQTLLVADNGLGMADGNRNVIIRGTGYGQGIVQKRMQNIGWEIAWQSALGEGTTFQIRPDIRQKIGWQTLTVEEINALSAAEQQIRVAEEVFDWVYTEAIALHQRLQSLKENDLQGWESAYTAFDQKMRKFNEWADLAETSTVAKLYRALWTAIGQIAYTQIDAGLGLKRLQRGETDWNGARQILKDPEEIIRRKLQDDGTFYHGTSRGFVELEDTLFAWLDANFPQRQRLNNGWQFFSRVEHKPVHVQNFKPTTWPPDPEKDLWFKSYLKLLGWDMKVRLSDQGRIAVTLTADHFIPTGEIPRLAKKFVEDIRALLGANETSLRTLANIEGLAGQRELFKREFERLVALFPQSDNPHLNAVMFKIQSGLNQIVSMIGTNMELGVEEVESGNRTLEQALEEIPRYPFPAEAVSVAEETGRLPVEFLFKELATALVELLQYRKPLESWDAKNKSWFLTYDKSATETVVHSEMANLFRDFPWPPKPEEQPALNLVLDLLGWELNVIEETQTEFKIEIRQK